MNEDTQFETTKDVEASSMASMNESTMRPGAEKLRSYFERRDDSAFSELVREYGPLVYGVCRRVTRNHHDAEDAFQATFLILSQKGISIKRGQALSSWLFQVAYRTSLRVKMKSDARRVKGLSMAKNCAADSAPENAWSELELVLDSELNRLPEKYRMPILLCDLRGYTWNEAAIELGWPAGTVSTRLAKARSLLAIRLRKLGFSLSVTALVGLLAQNSTAAAMPPMLLSTTVGTVSALSSGSGATVGPAASRIATIARESWRGVIASNSKFTALLLLSVSIAALVLQAAGQKPQPAAVNQVAGQEAPPALAELLKGIERYELSFFENKKVLLRYARTQVEDVTPSRFSGGELRTEWTFASKGGQRWRSERRYLDPGPIPQGVIPAGAVIQVMRDRVLVEWTEYGRRASIVNFTENRLNFYLGLIYLRNLSFDAPRWIAESNGDDIATVRKAFPDDAGLPFLTELLRTNQSKYRVLPNREEVDGHLCWIIEWPGMDKIWVSPELGYAMPRRVYHWGPGQPRRYEFLQSDYREVKAGLWLPFVQHEDKYASTISESKSIWNKVTSRCRYEVKSIDFENVPDELFELELPSETSVFDNVHRVHYRVEGKSGSDPFAEAPPPHKQAFPKDVPPPAPTEAKPTLMFWFLVLNGIVLAGIATSILIRRRSRSTR